MSMSLYRCARDTSVPAESASKRAVLGGCQGECLLSFLSYSALVKEPVQNTIFCFCSENEEMSCHIPIPENRIHLSNHSMNKEFTITLVLSIYH